MDVAEALDEIEAFARAARSHAAAHKYGGLAWMHPFRPAANDELGLGLSWVELSDAEGVETSAPREVAIELYYAFEPIPWVRVQPDLQVILNPGGSAELDDALLLSLRLSASL